MLKKTFEYVDYNGETKKKDYYFNLSKAEILEMELSAEGGLEEKIRRLMDEKDGKEIMKMFKEIILGSYGEKTIDGRFTKSPEISKKFSETVAYSDLFVELCTDPDAAANFVNGIIPSDAALADTVDGAVAPAAFPTN